jgi:hypothetical protein
MAVAGCRKPQCPLQKDVPRRAVEEIASSNDFSDTLFCIVDHDGEVVGENGIATLDDKIAAMVGYVLNEVTLNAIGKFHDAGLDSKTLGHGNSRFRDLTTTDSGIPLLVERGNLGTATGARKHETAGAESIERIAI